VDTRQIGAIPSKCSFETAWETCNSARHATRSPERVAAARRKGCTVLPPSPTTDLRECVRWNQRQRAAYVGADRSDQLVDIVVADLVP
jgi:hypothetical protein